MSQDTFVFNFNVNNYTRASQDFPKSNVVELKNSKWYLGFEKTEYTDNDHSKTLDIFLTCQRGTVNENYLVNLALILRGSVIDLLFTRTYYFEPMDLEVYCFKIDLECILDKENGFISENGECKIMAEISVNNSVEEPEIEEMFKGIENTRSRMELTGVINLQGGYHVRVNKDLLSFHSEYFNNIFNNEHFEESSQDAIDLTDFTYKQFRLLYKHIYNKRGLCTDGTVEYRLKSEDGVKEFQSLPSLKDVQKFCWQQKHNHTVLLTGQQVNYDQKSLKEILCMFNDVKKLGTLLGAISCVSTDYVSRENQVSVSAENVEDLLCVGSYFQIPTILESCKEFLGRDSDYPDFSEQLCLKLLDKYNLTLVTENSSTSEAGAQHNDLNNHVLTSGVKPYKCNQCSYASASPGTLKMHMRIHTGEKPYKCNQCSYASAYPGTLKMHMRIHTGEKPYKCNQCSYSCTVGSSLKVHMRTHNKEQSYRCDQCSFASANASALKLHMRTHIGVIQQGFNYTSVSHFHKEFPISQQQNVRTIFINYPVPNSVMTAMESNTVDHNATIDLNDTIDLVDEKERSSSPKKKRKSN